MSSVHNAGFAALGLIFLLLSPHATPAASDKPGTGTPLAAAICPIVYPVDQSPSERGYHYIFYGNAFFINKEGYLITAAHVLSQLHGAQPYILLQLPMAPPRLVKATVVIADQDHDVAVLRATPNPFEGRYTVNFLRLAARPPEQAHEVLADALRPSRLKNPYTFDALREDRPAGQVIEYWFTQLDKGRPDTEIFLFNHDVLLGDSGAPVVSGESQEVVGLVEGRWLHGATMAMVNASQRQSAGLGAVVPIHYAIALLQQMGIAWQGVPETSAHVEPDAPPGKQFSAPVPLSLVGAPYPSNVFSGGEVVLDALVESSGRLGDIRILGGENPFLQKVLAAVQTWTFLPARSGEQVVETRIGIVFQFPGSLTSVRAPQEHRYEGRLADVVERGALPIDAPEPQGSQMKLAEGSAILCELVDSRGQVDTVEVVRGQKSLTAATVAAARQWRFVPGRRGGANSASEVIVVVTFRRSATPAHMPTSNSTH
ncbi:MAG: energy transducer TonB [Candidatus Acidiferrales bacterium]